jgi:hypothetical protein
MHAKTSLPNARQENERLSRLQNKKADDFQGCKTRKQTTFKAAKQENRRLSRLQTTGRTVVNG